uniref:Uncharacterized protein n=1 Tax=Arundo donax TaxID=35708 RepID=A0A0A8ZJG5_ARUDO
MSLFGAVTQLVPDWYQGTLVSLLPHVVKPEMPGSKETPLILMVFD